MHLLRVHNVHENRSAPGTFVVEVKRPAPRHDTQRVVNIEAADLTEVPEWAWSPNSGQFPATRASIIEHDLEWLSDLGVWRSAADARLDLNRSCIRVARKPAAPSATKLDVVLEAAESYAAHLLDLDGYVQQRRAESDEIKTAVQTVREAGR